MRKSSSMFTPRGVIFFPELNLSAAKETDGQISNSRVVQSGFRKILRLLGYSARPCFKCFQTRFRLWKSRMFRYSPSFFRFRILPLIPKRLREIQIGFNFNSLVPYSGLLFPSVQTNCHVADGKSEGERTSREVGFMFPKRIVIFFPLADYPEAEGTLNFVPVIEVKKSCFRKTLRFLSSDGPIFESFLSH